MNKNADDLSNAIDEETERELMAIIAGDSDEPWSTQDDSELQEIIGIIEYARRPPILIRHMYEHNLETARRADELIQRPGVAGGNKEFMNKLKLLRDFHAARAEDLKPMLGKDKQPQKRYIVWALSSSYENGTIRIKPAANVDSRFARLFRACCRASGVDASTNIAHYLKIVQDQY